MKARLCYTTYRTGRRSTVREQYQHYRIAVFPCERHDYARKAVASPGCGYDEVAREIYRETGDVTGYEQDISGREIYLDWQTHYESGEYFHELKRGWRPWYGLSIELHRPDLEGIGMMYRLLGKMRKATHLLGNDPHDATPQDLIGFLEAEANALHVVPMARIATDDIARTYGIHVPDEAKKHLEPLTAGELEDAAA